MYLVYFLTLHGAEAEKMKSTNINNTFQVFHVNANARSSCEHCKDIKKESLCGVVYLLHEARTLGLKAENKRI